MKNNIETITQMDFNELILKSTSNNINVNKILICKDCEFRFVCSNDFELIYDNLLEVFTKKTDCKYNPYIAKWEGEEGYQTLEECGVISDETGFFIDHKKIAIINAGLEELETTE